jgi:uncharacterized protein YfaS (alpha-2-macroglobulin family)
MRNLLYSSSIVKGILLLLLSISLIQCKKKSEITFNVNPAFTEKIAAFTSGIISSESVIQIILTEDYTKSIELNSAIETDLFSFKPKIEGHAYWVDHRTVEFRPDARLKSGETYTARFFLSKLLEVTSDLKTFEFQFSVIPQTFMVSIDGFQSYSNTNLEWNKVKGTLVAADAIGEEELKKIITARQAGRIFNIKWDTPIDIRTFTFSIDSVMRSEKVEKLEINWDGSKIGIASQGRQELEIPALGDFKLMNVNVTHQPEQFILIQFSDPVKKGQNLEGLIYLENFTTLSYAVEGNIVKAYPAVRQGGNLKIYIRKGVLNVQGFELKEDFVSELTFEIPKPAVRLTGKGVILPNSKGLIFPFEAVNLNAVDIKIIKIFENNIGHFLQVNQLDGSNQLKRAGRLIHKQKVVLTSSPVDLTHWNIFYLELSKYIQPDPGSIYRLEIQFRESYSLYPCENKNDKEIEESEVDYDEPNDSEISYWDSYEDYYNDYYEEDYYYEYDWDERDNPCSSSYYTQNRFVARNILASDLGIIAKGGNNNVLLVSVTNLVTSQVMPGTDVTAYNYQQQPVAHATTDNSGIVTLKCSEKPFLLIAKADKQRGYLRLDDGSSLSLSQFDISGSIVQKGLKGFIYGERGVWRPGDTLFLIFVLEDKQNILPDNHPVVFEFYNPQGQLVTRSTKRMGNNGFYTFITSTRTDAPTGYWNARIKVGGTEFSKSLKIETIKPNRLKINIDFGVAKLTVNDKSLFGELEVKWLHGAPARNLKAKVDVTLTNAETSFDKYPDYKFTDPSRTFTTDDQTIFDGRIDLEGKARISAALSTEQRSPGMLKANLVTRVFEESGEFSTDFFSLPYSPYTSYVGIRPPEGDQRGMLLTDTLQWVDVVTVDNNGNPVNRTKLEIKIFKINWRYWWESNYDDLASYIGNNYNNPMVTKTVSTVNGKGKFNFRINRPEWGRFFIRIYDPVSGHAAGKIVYADWPGWAGRPLRDDPQAATMLTFNADKSTYNVGEKAEIIIPTSGLGRAFISLESGSNVLSAEWIAATEKEIRYSFNILPEMAPNIYVHVTLIQPHGNTTNDMPIRLYGVIPLLVENPETKLSPQIIMPDVLEPEKEVTIKINEKNNKHMTYTLAIVDEGLLDLTRFKTPDPWNAFYAREALGIKTWDLYDMVIGAYGGRLESILGIGGDIEEESSQDGEKANRFKPVVIFQGPFNLQEGKINTHVIKMPRYVGSVRTMVIAGADDAYGFQEKTTAVRSPLMVLATLPRVLGPGEEVKLPVTVFAMEKNIKDVTVQIKPNEFLIPQEDKLKLVHFEQVGDKVVLFSLKTASKLGIGKVTVIASSGNISATYNIELDVRPSNPEITELHAEVIDPGKSWSSEFKLPGMAGTNKGYLEISSIPPIDIERRLHYLITYPHGCVEQTTSAVFPQLYLSDIMELDVNYKTTISNNIKAGIDRLKSFLTSGGGFSYWPGENYTSDWGTSYAGHFLLEAEKKGYALPVGLKSSWLKYQKKMARQWRNETGKDYYNQGYLEQAYRLFTLAFAGDPEMGAMNRLREDKGLSLQAKWRLAASYVLAGQAETARQLIALSSTDITPYSGFYSSYGSMERDWAMILETLVLLNDRTKAAPLAIKISEQLTHDYWMSTQTTAYCLLAMAKFAGFSGNSKTMTFSYKINDSKTIRATTVKPVSKTTLAISKTAENGKIFLENNGQGLLYARIILNGIPETGNETSSENSIGMQVIYKDLKGSTIDVTRLDQGFDFMAVVTVNNSSSFYYKDLAITQIFPSGWEIRNTRQHDFQSSYEISTPTYQDIRDDRVYTYFHLNSGQSKTFVIQLNASYLGRFYLPGVYCEAMYDNSINAIQAGRWIEVATP